MPLHIDDQERSRSSTDLRFRKGRSPGNVWIIFARRDHPSFSFTKQRGLRIIFAGRDHPSFSFTRRRGVRHALNHRVLPVSVPGIEGITQAVSNNIAG
jgi:hypothetical protein